MKGFIVVEDMEGARGLINIKHIVSMVEGKDKNVIVLSSGKLATREHLGEIIQKIERAQQ